MSTSKPRCSKNQVRWQYAGIASDHGKRRSSCSSVEVSPSFGSSCKRNSRYPNGSSPLRLAVSIILKHNALASAPLACREQEILPGHNKGFYSAFCNIVCQSQASIHENAFLCLPLVQRVRSRFSEVGVFVLFKAVYIPFRRSH